MKSNKIEPKFTTNHNPRVGLIVLATDFMIERDFINVIKDKQIDFFVNRIECFNPLTKENLIKMSEKVTEVTNNILPIFTPYSKKLNDEIVNHFLDEKFEVVSNSYLDIAADYDIGKVDQDFLFEILSKMDISNADALFISCTALPVLNIIEKLEKKIHKPVLSSNQALIWNTLEEIGKNENIKGFGKLFLKNWLCFLKKKNTNKDF